MARNRTTFSLQKTNPLCHSFLVKKRNMWYLKTKEYSGALFKTESLNHTSSNSFLKRSTANRSARLLGFSPGIAIGLLYSIYNPWRSKRNFPWSEWQRHHTRKDRAKMRLRTKVRWGGRQAAQWCQADAIYRGYNSTARQLWPLVNNPQDQSFVGREKTCCMRETKWLSCPGE